MSGTIVALLLMQAIELGSGDGQAKALVMADQARDVAMARQAGATVDVFTARADLNGDGAKEIVAQISSGFLCPGAGGCPLLIYKAEGARFSRVGQFMGDGVDLLPTRTSGWRDLNLVDQRGTARLRWNGKAYVAGR